MRESKSKLSKLFNFILLLIIAVSLIMWIFNLTLSLPVTFAEVVEDNAEASVNEIGKIEIELSGYLPDDFNDLSDYIPPEDDREFIIEGEEVKQYINDGYRLYRINNVDRIRDEVNEYEFTLRFINGDSLFYTVGAGYIIDDKEAAYKVLEDENALYRKVIALFD